MKFNDYILVENLEVAKTILGQLGGNRFIAMTGAKNFVGDTHSVSFRIGRNSTQANGVKITLNSADLYDMEFMQASKNGIKILKVYKDLYNDQLRKVFTQFTGMYTSLFGEALDEFASEMMTNWSKNGRTFVLWREGGPNSYSLREKGTRTSVENFMGPYEKLIARLKSLGYKHEVEESEGEGKSPKEVREKCQKCGKMISVPVEKAGDALCGKCKDFLKTGYGNEGNEE